MLVCGNSDPGTSGLLSPFSKIKGLYFDESDEPDNFMFEFKQDIQRIMKEKGVNYIDISVDNKYDYYRIMNNFADIIDDKIKMVWKTNDDYKITLENVEEIDDVEDK